MKNYLKQRSAVILAMLLAIAAVISGCASAQTADSAVTETAKQVNSRSENTQGEGLEIHILDVGQGLSVFLRAGSQTMLYDGGDRKHSSFVVSYLQSQQVETLDYVMASHYDSDHINGVIGALHAFEVNKVIGPEYEHTSKEYQSLVSKVHELGKEIEHPAVGTVYQLGAAAITVLAPEAVSDRSNNNSIAIKIEHGGNRFIITGDAEYQEEEEMVASGQDLECEVLVVGHHGSGSSTTWDFLKSTVPEYAVISSGEDNSYGHPHSDTMEKLEAMEIEVFRTDSQGTIIAYSDGTELVWNVEPCNDYSAGSLSKGIVEVTETTAVAEAAQSLYVLNKNSKKVHVPSCSSAAKIAPENYAESNDPLDTILNNGYSKCGICLK